jgi:hypothetical protein
MKTKHCLSSLGGPLAVGPTLLFVLVATIPTKIWAEGNKKNPTSKVYVSDISGEAQIDTGDNIQDLNKRSVYTAQGTVIETKKADKEQDKGKVFSTMVYSNGTGAYFDEDTRVEVRKFVQEPFTPNRADMEVEPSISQTQAYVSRGTVGLCTSKLVAGSSMTYNTPHGAVNIRGKKVVIEATDTETKISMLEGDSTVRGGNLDLGGHTLHSGEQAILRPGPVGQPNIVTVQPIPKSEVSALDDKVAMACMAKKTVYFEVREKKSDSSSGPGDTTEVVANDTASGANSSGSSSPGGGGRVTAFDGPVANNGFASGGNTGQEIIAVPVVPVNLPVQFTISPARIVTPTRGPGG